MIRSAPRALWIALAVVGSLIAGTAIWYFAALPRPGISVLRELKRSHAGVIAVWHIKNCREDTLLIHRIAINRRGAPEQAPRLIPSHFGRDGIRMPIAALRTIEEPRFMGASASETDEVYLDLHTNRGNFRFVPGRGFSRLP